MSAPAAAPAPPERTSVSMSVGLHRKLKLIAAEESERRGARVSVADLVEQAVLAMLPQLNQQAVAAIEQLKLGDGWAEAMPKLVSPLGWVVPRQEVSVEAAQTMFPTAEAADTGPTGEQEFAELLEVALFADPSALGGALAGARGPVLRRDLALHLRDALNDGRAICSLEELIEDYGG